MSPIELPKYAIKPEIFAVFDDGVKHFDEVTKTQCLNIATQELDWEPTFENAQKFLDQFVPKEFHHTVDYVHFRADQLLQKIQFDQVLPTPEGKFYLYVQSYSVEGVDVYFNDKWHTKTFGKAHIKRKSMRRSDTSVLYIRS